jgi:hypothetical protein
LIRDGPEREGLDTIVLIIQNPIYIELDVVGELIPASSALQIVTEKMPIFKLAPSAQVKLYSPEPKCSGKALGRAF